MFTCTAKAVIPTDVKIYYENGIPYMEYRGVTNNFSDDKFEVYFPKIPLNISEFTWDEDYTTVSQLSVTFENYLKISEVPRFKIIEKNMTKAQIEKELGYKINIID